MTHKHVHFGVGKLGLGLVLPLIADQCHLAIFNRQSEKWDVLAGKEFIELSNSQSCRHWVRFVYDQGPATNADEIYSLWQKAPLFVCTNDPLKFKQIIESAQTISISLYKWQDFAVRTLRDCKFPAGVNLYPFENTPSKDLKSLDKNGVKVVKLVADRICTEVRTDKEKSLAHVKCEPWVEVFVLGDRTECEQLFGTSLDGSVKIVEDEHEYQYYYNRKRFLMNGLHMVLVVYSFNWLDKNAIPAEKWHEQYLNLLQEVILSTRAESSSHIWNFVEAQIMRLMKSTPDIILSRVFHHTNQEKIFLSLRRHVEDVLKRMRSSADVLERIYDLGKGEAANLKYEEHVKEVRKFVQRHQAWIQSLSIRMRPAYVDLETSIDDVIDLIVEISNKHQDASKRMLQLAEASKRENLPPLGP